MNIGGTSLEAPAQFAAGALRSALDTQASTVGQVVSAGTDNGAQMAQAAAAEHGKGQQLDMMV